MISRKIFYFAVLSLTTLLTVSCSQDDSLVESTPINDASASFRVNIPWESASTRGADANVKRYAIAIENVDDAENPFIVKLDPSTLAVDMTNGVDTMIINNTGSFDISGLTNGSKYVAYFWADYDSHLLPTAWQETGSYATYDIQNFMNVKHNWEGTVLKTGVMAYCGSKDFVAGSDNGAGFSVTLSHAVAEVNLIQETGKTTTESIALQLTYTIPTSLNLKDKTVGDSYETKLWPNFVAWTYPDNYTLQTIYMFASDTEQNIDFKMEKWNGSSYESIFTTDAITVPVKVNHKSNVKGDYLK